MAGTLLTATPPTAVQSTTDYPLNRTRNRLPTIDLTSDSASQAFETLSHAASTTGAALITNLSVKPPIAAIQRLFSTLYTNPTLASRLNATYPARGVFKAACLDPSSASNIDQKTTIDFSAARLQKLRELDPALVDDLGQDFDQVLRFYTVVETDILPLLMQATSRIAGSDLAPMHANWNNNLRLIDYFPSPEPTGPRCGEHRDYGTYTVVFQDGLVGGLEFDVDGKWIQVPANVDAVVSWGWCGAILSNDRVKAAKHRVLRTQPVQKRRTTAVVFVAPDLDATLKPVESSVKEDHPSTWSEQIMAGDLSVGQFKQVISKKWRRREGNEEGEVIEGAQDREVSAFVRAA
ncbi:hypothetical protein B0O99DRAFT_623010 [Bisporella sp. PMI_857]|nr:hypothetical protein B0O99DRAFT_623010 [Bisporella sp. PMI_857]